MPYVPVPKDLNRVKSKVAFNLTKRQIISFSIAGGVGIPFYLLTKEYLGISTSAVVMMILMVPFFFLAMYEKDGQPAERVIKNYVEFRWGKKRKRPYQTKNFYAELQREIIQNKEERQIEANNKRYGKKY